MTKILRISRRNQEKSEIEAAAEILRNGGLVAFPTETVYGLGADALNPRAVKKIFEAKGRPSDNPLIVHIGNKKEIYKLAREIPEETERLMEKFWPGPLTLVLKKSKAVPKVTTGGLDTVAIRMPKHRIALSLIKKSKVPIAAPSANLFSRPSPTLAEHVIEDLHGKIEAIIDGGKTKIGVESTVLDLTTDPPTLLRPGGITLEELEEFLGEVKVHPALKGKKIKKMDFKSPGMKYKHYAPNANVIVVEGDCRNVKKKVQQLADKYRKEAKKVAVMTTDKNHSYKADLIKFVGREFNAIAKNLFKTYREFDEEKANIIIVEGVENKGLGFAIMNRLKKASCKTIKV